MQKILRDSTKRLLEPINEFSKAIKYKVNTQKTNSQYLQIEHKFKQVKYFNPIN